MKKIGKYIFPIFFVLLVIPTISKGQKKTGGAGLHEIGAGIGGLNYTGELSEEFSFSNYRPGAMIFYRYNITPVVSFRLSIMSGMLHADESSKQDPIAQARKLSFSNQVLEFGTTFEYNFFNYRPLKEVYRFSPYFTSGLTFFGAKEVGGFNITIPMGVGIKYRVSEQVNLGAEFVARKTFTDQLDKVDSSHMIGNHKSTNPHHKDWYYYTGISLSWTFFSVECPNPDMWK